MKLKRENKICTMLISFSIRLKLNSMLVQRFGCVSVYAVNVRYGGGGGGRGGIKVFVHIIKMPQGLLFNRTLNFVFMMRFWCANAPQLKTLFILLVCFVQIVNFVQLIYLNFVFFVYKISLIRIHCTLQHKNAYNRHRMNR